MFMRHAIAVISGAAVTFGLLFLMQYLIASGEAAVVASKPRTVVDFVHNPEELPDPPVNVIPERPPPVEPPPPIIIEGEQKHGETSIVISFGDPAFENEIDPAGPGFSLSDGGVLPLRKVEPVYPARAIAQNLEGFVIVQFTVTRRGSVDDIEVLESSNRVFERAARDAASKFLYRPQVVDGEAVATPGVQNRITFQLE